MIVIRTKTDAVIIDERNVVDVNFDRKRKDAWVRIVKPDSKLESFNYSSVTAVEYRPSSEALTITLNDDGTEE